MKAIKKFMIQLKVLRTYLVYKFAYWALVMCARCYVFCIKHEDVAFARKTLDRQYRCLEVYLEYFRRNYIFKQHLKAL